MFTKAKSSERIEKLIKNAMPLHPRCTTKIVPDIFSFLLFCYFLQKVSLASLVAIESVALSVLLRKSFHHL